METFGHHHLSKHEVNLLRQYRYVNLLSIDVALGAVVSAAFFARVLNVELLPQGYALLALSVWMIYTADHLVDAWNMPQAATSERHLYHQKYFLRILGSLIVLAIVAIGLAFVIRVQILAAGFFFAAFVVVYLLFSRWLKYFKELAGCLLYTGGVLLPAWSIHEEPLNEDQQLYISIFALIVLANLLMFARLSMREDLSNQQNSLATLVGARTMNFLVRIVIVGGFALVVFGGAYAITPELITLASMLLATALVFEVKFFHVHDRYRVFGDGVFFIPLFLFISGIV